MNQHAPREQQLEGLRCVLKQVPLMVFVKALKNLVANRFLSKSEMHKYIKDARHIMGLSYDDYLAMIEVANKRTRTPQGGWF